MTKDILPSLFSQLLVIAVLIVAMVVIVYALYQIG
jgi:hypothetical protein